MVMIEARTWDEDENERLRRAELWDEIDRLRFQRDALVEALKVRGVHDDFIRTVMTVTIHKGPIK
jgi:hypothetical protein